MASFKVAVVFAMMMAAALCIPVYEEHQEIEQHVPAHYEFKYGVKDEHTHDIKEQYEKREGDKVTGYYKLVEPDGTTRTVHYTADKHTGFHAQVERSGHATHPTYEKKIIVPVKKIEVPIQYEKSSSLGSGSSFESSFGSSFGSSLGSSSLGSSDGAASSYSTFS